MADSKEIVVSIDIGDNITKLIEKLASQIGTTTDKVFPWYVKQQVIEGWCWIGVSSLAFVIGAIMFFGWLKKADFNSGGKYIPAVIIGAAISLIGMGFLFFGMSMALTQINNPEYHALKSMTSDMAQLISR